MKRFYLKQYTVAHVERSIEILGRHFLEIMIEQKVFEHAKCIELMLKIIGNRHEKLRERVNEQWTRSKNRSVEAMFGIMGEEIRRFECAKTVGDYAIGREPESKVQRLTFI